MFNFLGKVINQKNLPIKGAKVSFEGLGTPRVVHTDGEGVFRFPINIISGNTINVKVRVEAEGYELYDRNIDLSINNQNLEEIRLIENKIENSNKSPAIIVAIIAAVATVTAALITAGPMLLNGKTSTPQPTSQSSTAPTNPTPVPRESLEGSESIKKTVEDNEVGNTNITGDSNVVGNNNTINVNPQPTKKNKSIELFNLLEMFIIPSNSSGNVIDWSTGANENSPIIWETSGVSEDVRKGKVVVTIDGKISYHTLLNSITPGLWDIELSGPHAGVTKVSISSERFSHELDRNILNNKSIMPYLRKFKCIDDNITGLQDSIDIYEISIPGRTVAWLKKNWSCGTGGCGIWLEIIYDKSEAEKEECF